MNFVPSSDEQPLQQRTVTRESAGQSSRTSEVQVTGTAEVCFPADRVSVRVSVRSSKESVSDVSSSVSRRIQYIVQVLRQHGVKDEDTSIRKFLNQESDVYRMDAEVTVMFTNFEKMEEVCCVLLDKLDKSVCMGKPQFFHSAECLNRMRWRACVLAVENAQQKASEVSQLLGQSLGPPLLVREEETKEWRNEEDGSRAVLHPQCAFIPTVSICSRVSASFSLRATNRKNL
ncbi:interleukin-1 receptor-associated kinase 1-binding protein 1 homolog [Thalassophryne amazonica]|uniref:interleukin-1 receptor-associated kinase 1-binding protein 1 homolog n=1 Tax=Thalassophryne amazonica TaxID=390379 RepID=UPI001471E2E2|nr:interleukin-1 receptor-associated kinase 1-binding protein 1 homolog [Thalassophryne amazonica]